MTADIYELQKWKSFEFRVLARTAHIGNTYIIFYTTTDYINGVAVATNSVWSCKFFRLYFYRFDLCTFHPLQQLLPSLNILVLSLDLVATAAIRTTIYSAVITTTYQGIQYNRYLHIYLSRHITLLEEGGANKRSIQHSTSQPSYDVYPNILHIHDRCRYPYVIYGRIIILYRVFIL